ncbi:MAG: hypothetical protein EPO28_12165 [Saprospiraceae bacterium]|nr:MAG: hypothetical protein EPO28_12165 [Saprospiraceae bacterium]
MTRILETTLFLFLAASFAACQNHTAASGDVRQAAQQAAIEESTPEMLTTDKAEGKIVKVTPDYIELDNQTVITLPVIGSDTTTIYLTVGAEKMEGKTALTETGLAWAGHLATVFQHTGILQAYSDKDNGSMQTANITAQANECELNFFKAETSGIMMSSIIQEFKGRRVLVVVQPETASAILAQLSGNPKLRVPEATYENLFVILATEGGKAEIRHLLY